MKEKVFAVTRIRTEVAAATTQSTNHYTITARHQRSYTRHRGEQKCSSTNLLTVVDIITSFNPPTLDTCQACRKTGKDELPCTDNIWGFRPSSACTLGTVSGELASPSFSLPYFKLWDRTCGAPEATRTNSAKPSSLPELQVRRHLPKIPALCPPLPPSCTYNRLSNKFSLNAQKFSRKAERQKGVKTRVDFLREAEVATGGSGGGGGPGSGAGGGGGGPGSGPGPGRSGEKGPVESAPGPPEEVVVWSPEVEVCLFHAMLGHKPVGVNRHFHMICIRDKFSQNIGRQISSKVIWDHLSTMYDMQALHESEILPFPNSEKNFILPEEIIQEVKEGKVMIEDEVKEEIKEEMDSHTGTEDVFTSSGNLGKGAEKSSGKEKEKSSSDSGSKEGADKRKRNRVTEKVLNANSNPSSPSAAKHRRT
ncbi:uncharacterized protein LOC123256736 [Gracilinanus agilis]|uniref:uncharacterized protein LOC123256736 n=1 Tax=Gracilinanus agilis TaxID=191870 RepID=UPI001CFEB53F|nr:uncharacterized protein LOC123256736 [Gracilinanus agilis]